MQTQVYVGVSARTGGTISGLLRRGLNADTWESAALPDDTHVHAITVHPDDPAIVYAATSVGLFRSQDLGGSWQQIDYSVEVRSTMMAVALHPHDKQQAHCVTRGGQTFSTTDGGASWREYPLPEGSGAAVAAACG